MSSHEFSVGPIKIDPGLVLAPMSGITNSAFRRLIKSLNPTSVGLLVTEFISVEGLTRQNLRSLQMMHFRPEERPLSIQIFGHDIERLVDSAKMIQDAGADIVDINSGCPVPKVVRRGGGCELMRQPEHMAKILSSVRKAISIPLTLKIRAGWDDANRNAVQIARIAEDCGVQMLAVHGRTRAALYRGEADWDIVADVARAVSIPVVGSGDVVDVESAEALGKLRCGSRGLAGLMIGRGALANPWIFSELAAAYSGRTFTRPAASETAVVMKQYLSLLKEDMPDRAALGRLKQLASFVTRRVPGSTLVRKSLCQSQSVEAFVEILDRWEAYLNEHPTVQDRLGPIDWTRRDQHHPQPQHAPTSGTQGDHASS